MGMDEPSKTLQTSARSSCKQEKPITRHEDVLLRDCHCWGDSMFVSSDIVFSVAQVCQAAQSSDQVVRSVPQHTGRYMFEFQRCALVSSSP